MKITITRDDGTIVHRFTINPLFEEQDDKAADEIRELIETVWTTENEIRFMSPTQYAAYRAAQRLEGNVLRSPYPDGGAA